ncbi:hypothetical protein [Ruminococcus sp.]|uniref:hypothetical protein n=1 Tax=Ruminococcus sp. TaxID=41978 RepID=UPI0025E43104|nr:hypothetical protein [Ruminococcus sp.]
MNTKKDNLLYMKSTVPSNAAYTTSNHVWWAYNWAAYDDEQLPQDIENELTMELDLFLDEVYQDYDTIHSENEIRCRIEQETHRLLNIYPDLLSDLDCLYDYGGLNEFFHNIIAQFPFYRQEKYCSAYEMIFDCIFWKKI